MSESLVRVQFPGCHVISSNRGTGAATAEFPGGKRRPKLPSNLRAIGGRVATTYLPLGFDAVHPLNLHL